MAILIKLVAVVTLATLVKSRTTVKPYTEDSYANLEPYYVGGAVDSYALPLSLQLPKEEAPKVPFYTPEPSTVLRAPQLPSRPALDYYQVPLYEEIPVPNTDLTAPVETSWNPSNDPKFYYEVPVVLTKQETPTNKFPKKFNKDIHIKNKPFAGRPKEEIAILPIEEKEFISKQKNINKVFQNLAKKENQKQIQTEKVQIKPEYLNNNNNNEPDVAESGFDGDNTEIVSSENSFDRGLSADLTASLGITSAHSPATGERLEFHMVGHDGPHSYKWGYDTGKGHNRQFRYEERDKGGFVKGHYGFYDKVGKLQMVNYNSDPLEGFHVESNSDDDHSNNN